MPSARRGFLRSAADVFGLATVFSGVNTDGFSGSGLLKPPPESMFPSEKFLKVNGELEDIVEEIRKIRDEELNESSIYLGNVNSFDFSTIEDEIVELSTVEDTVGKEIGEMSDSNHRKLLEAMSTDRLNHDIEYGYMTKKPMADNVEPRLLIEQKADIDIVELGDTEIDPGNVGEQLEDSLSPVLGSDYALAVGTLSVDLGEYGSADEAFRAVQKEYSAGSSGTLQVYLTAEDLEEFGLMGYSPIDGNTVVVATEKGDMFQYDSQDVVETVVHETGHSLFDIQHTADERDVMYRNDTADVRDFGRRSRLLIQRYLDSSLETSVADTDDSSYLSIGFEPGEIDNRTAEKEFENHLETFLYDVMGFEDIENWKINYTNQNDAGDDEVRATRDIEDGERIEMDMEIDRFVDDISTNILI